MNWLSAMLALAGVVWLWRRGNKPYANPLPASGSLARPLQLLLSRGIHAHGIRGTLQLCLRIDPQQRIVFTKYIEGANTGFRATIPREAWVATHLPALLTELDGRGIPYRLLQSHERNALAFDLGKDYGGAHMVARLLFEDVMGLRLSRDCVVYFHDVMLANSPKFTGVDAPDEGWP
jgi:hypothetical protein